MNAHKLGCRHVCCRDIVLTLDKNEGKQCYLQLFGQSPRRGGKFGYSQWYFDFG